VDNKLATLEELGFTFVGHWKKVGENAIDCQLSDLANFRNALYAFGVDNVLMYVGKTTQTLRKRLAGYKNPSSTQSTNIKNNRNIKTALDEGKRVEIYVFPDRGLLQYGGFHLNLAAGLEDSLILALDPPWNGGQKDEPDEDATIPQAPPVTAVASTVTPPPMLDEVVSPSPERMGHKPGTADFMEALSAILSDASQRGVPYLDVRAGDLHKEVGGYDGPNHRMPACCNAMRKVMRSIDQILHTPPQDNGANLRIRYVFPRPKD
jgi:hypothetical protein